MLTLKGFHYISQICSRAKKVFNIVATERNRRVTLDGDQALNGKSQTSEWNTKTAPKAPVYIVELIRLCGADMFPPHDNELPCCVLYLPGPNTNRTLTCLYCHQQSKYWKRQWWLISQMVWVFFANICRYGSSLSWVEIYLSLPGCCYDEARWKRTKEHWILRLDNASELRQLPLGGCHSLGVFTAETFQTLKCGNRSKRTLTPQSQIFFLTFFIHIQTWL